MLMDQGARDHGHPPMDGAIPVQITTDGVFSSMQKIFQSLEVNLLKHAVLELENLGRETRKEVDKKENEYRHE